MAAYRIVAEHTRGQSASHPCKFGVYSDPIDAIDGLEIDADNAEEAELEAGSVLFEAVAETPPCLCQRDRVPGSDAWWNSVAFSARPTN